MMKGVMKSQRWKIFWVVFPKRANVTPIFKADAKDVVERQHGFVRGRSCATQLVLSHYQWSKALDEAKQVDVVFLKFEKAFDRVAHNILGQKTV